MPLIPYAVVFLVKLIVTVAGFTLSARDATEQCRCIYGDPCWPSNSTFSELATQLSQPLLHPVPPPAACYPSFPGFQNAPSSCSEVISQYSNATWRSTQPGAMENTELESFYEEETLPNKTHTLDIQACFINVTLSVECQQGSVPPIGVDARNDQDVQAAVRFAAQHNLRLVVKNTGHDLIGRSSGKGGFMVWTHNMKDMTYDAAFIPEGAPQGQSRETFNAVTLGAGVQWSEAYDFVEQQGRFITGGISLGGSVGSAGGWVMGGGHSAFSPSFGLGVDNALQFTIVLSSGVSLTTNKYQSPDLFWALRGGGGGTYGIVTSVTYKTYPIFPMMFSFLNSSFQNGAQAQEVLTQFIKIHPALSDAGWGGYSGFTNSSIILGLYAPLLANSNDTVLVNTNKTFWDLVALTNTTTGGAVQASSSVYPSFNKFFNVTLANKTGDVGGHVYITSRMLSRNIAVNDPAKAAKIMLSLEGIGINSVAGGAVSQADPSSTGLNPAWRKSIAEVFTVVTFEEGDSPQFILNAIETIKRITDVLDPLAIDSAAYLNEASPFERNFQKSFFGTHYSALEGIKAKYDPIGLFVVPSGVGSERWDSQLRCRV